MVSQNCSIVYKRISSIEAVVFMNQDVLYESHEGLFGCYSGKYRDEKMHTKLKECYNYQV